VTWLVDAVGLSRMRSGGFGCGGQAAKTARRWQIRRTDGKYGGPANGGGEQAADAVGRRRMQWAESGRVSGNRVAETCLVRARWPRIGSAEGRVIGLTVLQARGSGARAEQRTPQTSCARGPNAVSLPPRRLTATCGIYSEKAANYRQSAETRRMVARGWRDAKKCRRGVVS
jgi:hypothetical protein